jgi:hypothetical protein
MKTLLTITITFSVFFSYSQEDYNPTQKVGFIYIYSGDDFETTQTFMYQAADSLDIDIDNSRLYDDELGLTDTITCGCGLRHGYLKRGRYDEGEYVSIELSNDYDLDEELEADRYLVVVASFPVPDEALSKRISAIRVKYPDAKYFEADIYIGCMH